MSTATRFCTKCGALIQESTRFCPKCGAAADITGPVTPKREGHPARWLAVGLTVLLIGVLFLLSQRVAMPTEVLVPYLVAGLGGVLVISGLASLSGRQLQRRKARTPRPKESIALPRKAKFSGQLGIEHAALIGRKILFEFDPSMPYQMAVRDFALECTSNKEKVLILTPAGSVVEHGVHGDESIEIVGLTHDLMLSSVLEDHQERPLSIVYDSLTDLALSADPRTAYKFTLNALRQLSEPQVTALFLLNPSAHEAKDVSSLRGLFSNQIVYGKEGVSSIKLT
jgi:hypothetical protein